MTDLSENMLWANSGDSHLMEPPDLFASLPDGRQGAPAPEREGPER